MSWVTMFPPGCAVCSDTSGWNANWMMRFNVIWRCKSKTTWIAAGAVWGAVAWQAGSSLLFGVGSTDPLTFLAVSLLLIAAAAAACCFPARRAMKIEPILALRLGVIEPG